MFKIIMLHWVSSLNSSSVFLDTGIFSDDAKITMKFIMYRINFFIS